MLTSVASIAASAPGETVVEYVWYGFLLSFILLALLAFVALFAFGGVRRNGPALLAVGVFALVTGAVFWAVMQASMRARMDNAYLFNAIIGSWLLLVGVILPGGALVGYGVRWWVALPLMVVGIVAGWYAVRLGGVSSSYGGEPIIIFSASLLIVVGVIVLARGYWRSLALGALLGRLAAAVVLVSFLYGHPDVSLWALTDDLDLAQYRVPYVDFKEVVLCLLVGVALFLLARRLEQGVTAREAVGGAATGGE